MRPTDIDEPRSPAPRAASARPGFRSEALYELVAGLGVAAYEDLLADHWVVPDRASRREGFDPSLYRRGKAVGSRPARIACIPGAPPVAIDTTAPPPRRPRAVIVVGAGCAEGARALSSRVVPETSAPKPRAESLRNLLERGRRLLTSWWQRFRR